MFGIIYRDRSIDPTLGSFINQLNETRSAWIKDFMITEVMLSKVTSICLHELKRHVLCHVRYQLGRTPTAKSRVSSNNQCIKSQFWHLYNSKLSNGSISNVPVCTLVIFKIKHEKFKHSRQNFVKLSALEANSTLESRRFLKCWYLEISYSWIIVLNF